MYLFEAGGTLQGAAGTAAAITVTVSGISVDAAGVETLGLLYQGQLPASAGILFTVPAGKSWIVKTIIVTNATGGAVTGVQLFQNGAAAANSLIGPLTMAGSFTLTGSENGWAMTDASGVLQISSSGGGGGGTVTSVGLSLPAEYSVTGSPVTGSGTLTATKANQTANTVYAGPNTGSPAVPGFRPLVAADIPSVPGSLLNIQYLTTPGAGTYTATAGTNSVVLQMVGGGGGSSGVGTASGSQVVMGGAGGGGAFLQKRLTANFSGAGFVVGAGGTAGASGNNAGGTGTSTTFTSTGGSPVTYTAGGGIGGLAGSSLATPVATVGVSGGAATNGDINVPGGPSANSLAGNTFSLIVGAGGNSHYGAGAVGQLVGNATSSVGIAGLGFGGGASGAGASNGGTAKAGAAGAQGIIIVYEYS